MEIIYRANDGTEFTNEQDCINYENRMSCLCDKKHFIAFNSDFEPYDITPNSIEDVLEMMEYFICLTDEAVAAFDSAYKEAGFCAPVDEIKVNTYYGWEVANIDQWDAFPDVWEAINKEIDRVMGIENALSENVKQACGE